MSVITRTYDPAEGPILHVRIAPAGAPGGQLFPLLLDTGADGSLISEDVIKALDLTPVGKMDTHASGGKQLGMYTFIVDLSFGEPESPITFNDLLVSEFRYIKPSTRGLIGRDILCKSDFTMSREHTFTLDFP